MLAGVDGCPGGWVAALRAGDGAVRPVVMPRFADLLAMAPRLVAVDMPIGLPERVTGGGRGPEQAVRPLLGARQSSVFAVPGRAAVRAGAQAAQGMAAIGAAHAHVSEIALGLSDPPRKVSRQAFHIFPKICEIDDALRAHPEWVERVFEVHPEVAFWRMNGRRALATPKKIRGRVNPEGLEERRALLLAEGLPGEAVHAAAPRGAGADDWLDALAGLVAAARLAEGRGRPHPDPFERDAHGLPVAIWSWD